MSFGSAEFWIALLELVGVNIVRSGDNAALIALAARVRLVRAAAEVGFHRGRIAVHAPAVAPCAIRWRGDALAIVLGIGVDVAFQAAAGTPGCIVRWRPKGR